MQTLPTTIAEAATYMLAQLDEAQTAKLRAMSDSELIMCHFGLGMRIRNELKLWESNHPLANGEMFFDADSCSMAIVELMWKRLQNEA
jgi:ribonuclease HI